MVDIFYVYLYVGYLYVNQKMVLEVEIILREIVCVYRDQRVYYCGLFF